MLNCFHSNYNCLKNSIRFNNELKYNFYMSKIKQAAIWVGIIGGGIGFFFFSIEMAEFMR